MCTPIFPRLHFACYNISMISWFCLVKRNFTLTNVTGRQLNFPLDLVFLFMYVCDFCSDGWLGFWRNNNIQNKYILSWLDTAIPSFFLAQVLPSFWFHHFFCFLLLVFTKKFTYLHKFNPLLSPVPSFNLMVVRWSSFLKIHLVIHDLVLFYRGFFYYKYRLYFCDIFSLGKLRFRFYLRDYCLLT